MRAYVRVVSVDLASLTPAQSLGIPVALVGSVFLASALNFSSAA